MVNIVEVDLAVLGAGPGGYAAAFLAADHGLKVALIDARNLPGGTCLHVGCIPSKALLHTAKLIQEAKDAAIHLGVDFGSPKIDLDKIRSHTRGVVETLSKSLGKLSNARNITSIEGKGKFLDKHTILVDNNTQVTFNNAIIATGSSPFIPEAFKIGSSKVMDSTGALQLEEIPEKLLIVGGGYIGLEMGFVYASFGSKVTVVEMTDCLLPGADRDLVRPLQKRLEGIFDRILLKTKVTSVEENPQGVNVTIEHSDGKCEILTVGRVLVSVGRRPNSANLGLDRAGITLNSRGFIEVDDQRRTMVPHIYAIGDVTGDPGLAHKATVEGKVAAESILGEAVAYDSITVPAVVFTDPEVAWAGLTETEALKTGRKIKKVSFPWLGSGRALTLARTEGITKLIVDPITDRLLGVGLVGVGAGELIGEAMVLLEMGATSQDLALTMHAHPTLSETLMEAAEILHGKSSYVLPLKK
ncbi:MAG: dihydrolipoyl dehydrogenase [Planctomycetota bacterium]|nr:dihydrolipoyl dehydrogenase [Planctomycetota bacterium]